MATDIDALMQEEQDTNLAAEQLRMKLNALTAYLTIDDEWDGETFIEY